MSRLLLQDGTTFEGESFGASFDGTKDDTFGSGEVVFNTGMVGYPESLTDPSYRGQILVFTYPLIGNYGVPSEELNAWNFSQNLESEAIHVRGVIMAQVSDHYSHHKAVSSLHRWLEKHNIPGLTGVDTRALTKRLREEGVMLGRIQNDEAIKMNIDDPNKRNLVAEVSCTEVLTYEPSNSSQLTAHSSRAPTVLAYDCGMKRNILRSFLKRGVRVVRVPWNFDLNSYDGSIDGVFISNGPGDPKMCTETIKNIRLALDKNIPTFGICLGTQLMALAIGGDTYKLKYGHRGANQPCVQESKDTKDSKDKNDSRCIITSQNHGFAVEEKSLPEDWSVSFRNANDYTVEGIMHTSGRFFAVQFHPEATPGPEDANYLFDEFLACIEKETKKEVASLVS